MTGARLTGTLAAAALALAAAWSHAAAQGMPPPPSYGTQPQYGTTDLVLAALAGNAGALARLDVRGPRERIAALARHSVMAPGIS